MISGSTPALAVETSLARGLIPSSLALSAVMRTRADAPSLTPDALPAVTVPPFLKAGFMAASFSMEMSLRGCSSVSMMIGPFLVSMVTGTISSLKVPFCMAEMAR